MNICESCHQRIHADANGYWVGQDGTSDCPVSPKGHTQGGQTQA